MAKKNSKTAFAATLAEITSVGFTLGQSHAQTDKLTSTLTKLVKGIAEKNAKQASDVFATAYIAGKLNPDAERITDEMVTAVGKITEKAHWSEDNAPTKDGRQRNTLAEKHLRDAARKAWSRLVKDEGMDRADKRGGARQPKTNKPKTPSKATIPLIAKSAKDAASNVAALKAGWLSMLAGFKELTLTPEEIHEGSEVTIHLNRLEKLLAERKAATK